MAVALLSLLLSGTAQAASREPLLINQIAIDPKDPRIVYAAARPQGVLKSTDRGMSWHPIRTGLMNTSAYHLVVNPANPKILYLGTFGGGVYKSENAGERWFEANRGLGNTNIHALALNPLQPDQLIVSTSTGELFKSDDAGTIWTGFSEGLPFFPDEVIASFLILPNESPGIYLAQGGLFKRPFFSHAWQEIKSSLYEQIITAFAFAPPSQTFYAGTMKAGLFTVKLNPQDQFNWISLGEPFQKQWIRLIAIDPLLPSVIYVGMMGRGLYKSMDSGSSWKEIDNGLPTKDVESLAIDPKDSKRLYAGTHNDGLFISTDGGLAWSPPAKLEVEPVQQIISSLMGQSPSKESTEPGVGPPPSFAKCNQCHGWTDPLLNQKTTFWRVPPNIRDWQPTVQRMGPGAGLTKEEEGIIIRFLTEYSQRRKGKL